MPTRIKLEVFVNLDEVPGTFHTPKSARETVGSILRDRIGHYDPIVEVGSLGPRPVMYRDQAIPITPQNMPLIRSFNNGEDVHVLSGGSYFIKSDDPDKMNLVLPWHIFRRCFRYVDEESRTGFRYVEEIK